MKSFLFSISPLVAVGLALSACSSADTDIAQAPAAFSSNQATLLDFAFDGEAVVASTSSNSQTIRNQMLYLIGQLNGHNSVARLDRLVTSNVTTEDLAGNKKRIRYHATIPVSWGSKTNLPTGHDLVLPRNMDTAALSALYERVKDTCQEEDAHDPDLSSFWYYYRPEREDCELGADDVVRTRAAATVSPENTTGKYPEYDRVWSDDALKVVAIFGKYEDGTTTAADSGIAGYNAFVRTAKQTLGSGVVTVPANVSDTPGVAVPDVTLSAELSGQRRVEIVALLVDNVRETTADFDARYEALSADADLIAYNGHAGLGSNVAALTRKGRFVAGKYQIFFMNGCDTFAYVDGYLAEARAALNPDDPTGTKYMEIVTNAMPSWFSSMPGATMAIVNGLRDYAHPKTYDQIFADIDDDEVVGVTGEEDNTYHP